MTWASFAPTALTIAQHVQMPCGSTLSKSTAAANNDDREEYPPEYEEDDNSDSYFKFVFKED